MGRLTCYMGQPKQGQQIEKKRGRLTSLIGKAKARSTDGEMAGEGSNSQAKWGGPEQGQQMEEQVGGGANSQAI